MKVKNINGRSNTCKCKSLLVHWEKFSGKTAGLCLEATCHEVATVGAPVQKSSLFDQDWYVIPLCDKHSRNGGAIRLRGSATLVSAHPGKTCAVTKYNIWGAPYWR